MGCVLALGFLLATPAEGRALGKDLGKDRGVPDAVAAAAFAQSLDTTDVESYWTADRMKSALPLGLDELGNLLTPRAAETTTTAAALAAPRSVGKLFFTTPEGNAVCSASTVNTAEKNLIITAAHCAHSGMPKRCGLLGTQTCPGAYYTNFLFVPRYSNGSAPDGKWVGTRAYTHSQWINEENLSYDQAVIAMAPKSGRNVVSVVGGNAVAWNYPLREDRVSVWGWPAESPYDGETVQKCAGSTSAFEESGDAKIPCPLTGGASGGPWFISMANANVGYIWAVTSRRTTTGTPYLIADPFGNEIQTLLGAAQASAPTRTSTSTSTPRASSRLPLVVRPTLIQRGQPVVLRSRAAARVRTYLVGRYSANGAWHRIASKRTDRDGLVVYQIRPSRVGLLRLRVRTAKRTSRTVAVQVVPCPLPLDRSAAVVSATRCTRPAG